MVVVVVVVVLVVVVVIACVNDLAIDTQSSLEIILFSLHYSQYYIHCLIFG